MCSELIQHKDREIERLRVAIEELLPMMKHLGMHNWVGILEQALESEAEDE